MRTLSRLIFVSLTAVALLHAQASGGRWQVTCLDGTPCPLKKRATAAPAKPSCCAQTAAKTCHEPLPPQCVVSTTRTIQLSKPPPADAPKTPLATPLPAAAPVDPFAPKVVVSRFVASDDFIPAPAPPVAVHGPRAPPILPA